MCNLNWQEVEEQEEQEEEEEESQTTTDINRQELPVFQLEYFSLLVATISLSLSLVLLTIVLLSLYWRRRSQKNRVLEKFYNEKVCLISNQI